MHWEASYFVLTAKVYWGDKIKEEYDEKGF